jgi:hypothetical protein
MTFEEEFEAAELKHVFVNVRGANQNRYAGFDPGTAIQGAYKVVAGQVMMCDAHGREVIDNDGRKYRHTLKFDAKGNTPSGELTEREAASILTKEIKSKLKINGDRRVGGFGFGPLRYPRGYGGSVW